MNEKIFICHDAKKEKGSNAFLYIYRLKSFRQNTFSIHELRLIDISIWKIHVLQQRYTVKKVVSFVTVFLLASLQNGNFIIISSPIKSLYLVSGDYIFV